MTKLFRKTFFITLFTCLFIFPLTAGEQSRCFTVKDIFDYEYVSDPQISPDGTTIVYVRNFSDIMTDKRYTNLWMINFDGTEHRPLTSGNFNDTSPRWSPDGTQLIYVSNRDEKVQIYKRWMDSGQTVVLTNLQYPPTGITWSPNGKHIAYTSLVPFSPPKIAELPAAPPGAQWADPAIVIDKMVYRFDKIGYLKGVSHLYVLPAEGGTPRQLSHGEFDHRIPLVWTPDSKYILLSANRKEKGEFEPDDTEIFEFSVANGTAKVLTQRHGPDSGPAISPDGRTIAYTGYDERYQGFQITKLYVMKRDGSKPKIVTRDLDRSVGSVHWAADGKGLYFEYSNMGNTKLGYTSVDGKVKDLAGNIGSGVSAYGGGQYSVSPNGHFAMTYSRPDHPSDIAVGTIIDQKVRVITSVNADILANKKLGECEEIWYISSHDGRRIQGWIIKPPGFDSTKKYPLIIEIHGGPWADYGDRFDIEKQCMASSGYVVLYTNPRGSTSYGEEFGNLIHHAYPGDDFYDLNSGVDAVIEKGYIDVENLFVTGGSGGGVLTSWMIGRTTRFRAAVTVYPVINWYSFVLTTDIPIWGVKYVLPGNPWDNVEHYENRSLLSVVKNVKTLTMVLCGEEDWRCPISESEQYYRALKLLGVDSVLVRVPKEPHGIRVRPSHHVSKIQHVIGWFDRYKK